MILKEMIAFAAVIIIVALSLADSYACEIPGNDTTYAVNANTTLCNQTYEKLRIQMNADNIVLDCNGSVLDGANKTLTAITIIDYRDNTTVVNCTIKGYQYGYYTDFSDTADDDYIKYNTFYNNTRGVDNIDNWHLQIIGNRFELNDYGVYARPARYYNISQNTFINQTYAGLFFAGGGNHWYDTVDSNNFTSSISSSFGQIEVDALNTQLHRSNITRNAMENIRGPAIRLIGNAGNFLNISSNRIVGINGTAIVFWSLNASVVNDNYIRDVYDYGLDIFMQVVGGNNTIQNNTIIDGGSNSVGIRLFNTIYNSTFRDNYISNFTYPLYHLSSSPAYNLFYNNVFNTSSSNSTNSNATNEFNTTFSCSAGFNIVGGGCIGGNYWGRTDGNGLSDKCMDGDSNGICDGVIHNSSGIADYLPLSKVIDAAPPPISDVNASMINTNTAVITWITNESANSSVNYGNTTALGSFNSTPAMVLNHSVALASLSIDTTYFFNITSCDSSGNCNTSGPFNFTATDIIEISMDWSEWNSSATTNFSQYSRALLENISNVTFVNQYGGISYLEPLNISESKNITGNMAVLNLSIFVNSTSLPEFNRSALLTFSSIALSRPVVKRNGLDCADYCQNGTHNASAGTYTVIVSSFSTYSLAEQCGDGMQNYNETGIDCGGVCSSCSVTESSPGCTGCGGGGGSVLPAQNNTNRTSGNITFAPGGNRTNATTPAEPDIKYESKEKIDEVKAKINQTDEEYEQPSSRLAWYIFVFVMLAFALDEIYVKRNSASRNK